MCSIPLVPAALVLTVCLLINCNNSMRKRKSVLTVCNITDICECVDWQIWTTAPSWSAEVFPPSKHRTSQSRSVQSVPVHPLHTEWLQPGTLSLVRQRGNVVGNEIKKQRVGKMTRSKMERFRLFLRDFVSPTRFQWSDSNRPDMFALYLSGSSQWIIHFSTTKPCRHISLFSCLLTKKGLI